MILRKTCFFLLTIFLLNYGIKAAEGDKVNNVINVKAISSAIQRADVKELESLLKIIEIESNTSNLLVPGCRQTYNLVNLAVDPHDVKKGNDDLKNRLAIIDLLGFYNFNFNFIPSEEENHMYDFSNLYRNPPLISAYGIHGNGFNPSYIEALQARLMLYGADPEISGSTMRVSDRTTKTLSKIAFDMVFEENLRNTNLAVSVKKLFKELKEEKRQEERIKFKERMSRLDNLNF